MAQDQQDNNITRRTFLKDACVLSTSALAFGASAVEAAGNRKRPKKAPKGDSIGMASSRPNIVFIFSDQQRWDTLGCYGQKMDISPNLDKMAKQGVLFTNSFTCQPVCGPARAALQTGKYPTTMGCHVNGLPLPVDSKTMADYLSDVGYEVGYIGKWHLAHESPVSPSRRGGYKDYWLASDVLEFTSHSYDGHMFNADMERVEFPKDRYRVDCCTDYAVDYLKTRTREKPFFLFLSYIEPHFQNDHKHFEGPRGSKEKYKDFEVPGDLVGTAGDWREEYPDYLGCCNSIDINVGRIRETLEKLGMAENTLVVYTSDHACHFRTRNSEYKRSCHDDSMRTPLIVYGPGFTGGKVIDNLVSLIDLTPTLMTAAGCELPKSLHGRPLQVLIDGGAKDWPEEIFAQISESQIGRAIRTKKWKYSVRAPKLPAGPQPPASDVYCEDFLYDLEKDPHERNNLVADPAYAAIRAELAATLKRRMVAVGEKEPEIRPAAEA